jgi:hypothetical protein
MKFLLVAAVVAASLCAPVFVGADPAHAGWKCVKPGTGGAVCDKWVETPTKPAKASAEPPQKGPLINKPTIGRPVPANRSQ